MASSPSMASVDPATGRRGGTVASAKLEHRPTNARMKPTPKQTMTRLIERAAARTDSEKELLTVLYDELRDMAENMLRSERDGHTLQATALVHEAWARMADPDEFEIPAESAGRRFVSLAARSMRRVLIDHARARGRDKRGAGWHRVTLGDVAAKPVEAGDLIDLDAAITELESWSPRLAHIAELRLFAGLDRQAVADTLGVSLTTATNDWAAARAILAKHLADEPTP